MPTPTLVSTHFVRPLARALAASGVDADALVTACGLVGPHPMRVPITQVNAVWQAAVAESGDPAIGVRTAMALETGDYGVLEYAARASATLREGFERVGRYQKLLNDRAAVEFHDQGDVTTMVYLPTRVPAAYVEFVLASWVTFGRVLPAGPLPITAVHLTHAPPNDTSIHRAVFGSVIKWEAKTAQLRLDRVAFTRPLAADPALVAVLDRHAAALMEELARSHTWSAKVVGFIEAHLRDGAPRLADAAAALGVAERTLRRRLDDEGHTFSGLLDATRHRVSLSLVEDAALSLGEVAFLLGFSEPSAFHRAFRRWTGQSPRAGSIQR